MQNKKCSKPPTLKVPPKPPTSQSVRRTFLTSSATKSKKAAILNKCKPANRASGCVIIFLMPNKGFHPQNPLAEFTASFLSWTLRIRHHASAHHSSLHLQLRRHIFIVRSQQLTRLSRLRELLPHLAVMHSHNGPEVTTIEADAQWNSYGNTG